MKLTIEVNTADVKRLLIAAIQEKMPLARIDPDLLTMQVQTYRDTSWESGDARIVTTVEVDDD